MHDGPFCKISVDQHGPVSGCVNGLAAFGRRQTERRRSLARIVSTILCWRARRDDGKHAGR